MSITNPDTYPVAHTDTMPPIKRCATVSIIVDVTFDRVPCLTDEETIRLGLDDGSVSIESINDLTVLDIDDVLPTPTHAQLTQAQAHAQAQVHHAA